MKRILAFVLVILMTVGALWGCQKSESQSPLVPGLSDERAHEIQVAVYDFHMTEMGTSGWMPWFDQGYNWGMCYLGSAEGYDFI